MLEMTKNELNYAVIFRPDMDRTLHKGFVHNWSMIGETGAIVITFIDGCKIMTSINCVYIEHMKYREL